MAIAAEDLGPGRGWLEARGAVQALWDELPDLVLEHCGEAHAIVHVPTAGPPCFWLHPSVAHAPYWWAWVADAIWQFDEGERSPSLWSPCQSQPGHWRALTDAEG